MGESKITNFDDLRKKDATAFDAMVELAKEAKPVPMEGNHIAIFGVVARGKSTFVNSTIGRKVAETGKGETTTKLAAYPGHGFTMWDVPGRNDNLSYFTLEYIGFWKGLRHRVILVTDTVKEMTTVCRLMDELSLEYTIVVNRLQFADEEEESTEQRQKFEQQIKDEVVSLELKCARDRVYFISARTPAKYPEDWNDLQKMLMSE